MFSFLGHYAVCANLTMGAGKRRFAMTPKHHMLAHDAHDLLDQSLKFHWVENPLTRTNQVQEDFIGRPSRLSRRVSTRSLPNSVMMRALIIYEESLKAAARDSRGMDAYPN